MSKKTFILLAVVIVVILVSTFVPVIITLVDAIRK
jgi:hypothetical protein